ncbi:uncharacterized protein LOC130728725 isoform X2 [Lotus japonicus]|uniref:uncharacterized protein LOC130728725 isoform X2 n=1 Tax=Lotus japonicus TaxID=34305 RepID=UPI0025899643|nr:uncharacterized protein LOC130728725 isoform X2 [Lotus japonicus]
MGRRKNQDYWNQVTKVTVEENGKVKEKVKCKRCGDVFAGGVSRIRPHVDQIPGKGISVCTVDPVDEGVHNNVASGSSIPQEAMNVANSLQVEDAYQPIDSSIGGSINHQDNVESNYLVEVAPELIGTNIGGSINHQSNVEFNYFVKGAPGMISTNIGGPVNHQDTVEYGDAHGMISDDIGGPVDHQDNVEYGGLRHNVNENNNVTGAFEEEINQLSQIISDLQRDEDDIKGQLQWLESRGKKRKREDDNWLHELEGFKRRAGHMIQSRSLSGL